MKIDIKKLFKPKKRNLKKEKFLKITPKQSKLTKFTNSITETFDLLSKINYKMKLKEFVILTVLVSAIGILIGVLLKNVFLSLLLAVAFPLIAFELLFLKRKEIENYIERQIITYAELLKNSFLTTGSVILSIKEITERMEEPCKDIFVNMVNEVDIYNYSVKESLLRMNDRLKSQSLKELTEQLILCDRDSRYITSLQTAVAFMNDKKEFMAMWDYRVKDISQKLITLIAILNILVVMSYFTFPDMIKIFLAADVSKILLAIYLLIQLIVFLRVMKKIQNVQF